MEMGTGLLSYTALVWIRGKGRWSQIQVSFVRSQQDLRSIFPSKSDGKNCSSLLEVKSPKFDMVQWDSCLIMIGPLPLVSIRSGTSIRLYKYFSVDSLVRRVNSSLHEGLYIRQSNNML